MPDIVLRNEWQTLISSPAEGAKPASNVVARLAANTAGNHPATWEQVRKSPLSMPGPTPSSTVTGLNRQFHRKLAHGPLFLSTHFHHFRTCRQTQDLFEQLSNLGQTAGIVQLSSADWCEFPPRQKVCRGRPAPRTANRSVLTGPSSGSRTASAHGSFGSSPE